MTLDNVRTVGGYAIIFSSFTLVGSCFAYTVYGLFNTGVININIINTVNWFFDLIFNSLNFLGFFIRPSTIKIVAESFTFYWLLRIWFKAQTVFVKLARFVYSYLDTLMNKTIRFICKLFGI